MSCSSVPVVDPLDAPALRVVDALDSVQAPCPAGFAPTRDDVLSALVKLAPRWEPGEAVALPEPGSVWRTFQQTGVAGISGPDGNGLSVDENRALFDARSVTAVLHAVLLGLTRLRRGGLIAVHGGTAAGTGSGDPARHAVSASSGPRPAAGRGEMVGGEDGPVPTPHRCRSGTPWCRVRFRPCDRPQVDRGAG